MRKLLSILLVFLCIGNFGYAQSAGKLIQPLDENLKPIQESANKKLDLLDFTLESAIKLALKNNRNIISAKSAVDKASAKVMQARAIFSPKLNGSHSQTRLDDVGQINFGGQSIAMGKKDIAKSWLELTQPLYLGDKGRLAVDSARLGRGLSKSAFILTQQNLVMKTTIDYLSWIYAREVELVAKKDKELAMAHRQLVESRYKNSIASKFELMRAEVRLTQAGSNYLQKQNETELARLRLLNLLVLPLDSKLESSCRLEIHPLKIDQEKDLKNAGKLRPDLEIKKLEKKIAGKSVKAAFAEKKPSLVAFGQYGTEDPSSKSSMGTFERKEYWNAGISLNFPIIDGGETSGKIREARAGLAQAQNNLQDAIEQIELEVKNAALTFSTARQIVLAQKENLKQAEETLRLAKVRYENGMLTQVELFDAENAYSNSNLAYLSAVFKHHRARINYLMAVGLLGREYGLGYSNHREIYNEK